MWYNTTGPIRENKKGERDLPPQKKNQHAVSQSIDNKRYQCFGSVDR